LPSREPADAFHGGAIFRRELEANHVNLDVEPGLLERAGGRTGITTALLAPIGDQDHRILLALVFAEDVERLEQRRRDRRLTHGPQTVDPIGQVLR